MNNVLVAAPYALEKANPTDVGYDLKYWGDSPLLIPRGSHALVPTACSIKVTPGHIFDEVWDIQLRGRSSLALQGLFVHVGTIDQTYHDEIKVVMYYIGQSDQFVLTKGNKIAQLVFAKAKIIKPTPVDSIPNDRGGFGSSGL